MENYLRHQKFPYGISAKGDKVNFRRACKNFSVANGQLMYKGNRLVVTDKQRRIDIIHDVHEGLGNNVKAVAMSSHLGTTSPYQKIYTNSCPVSFWGCLQAWMFCYPNKWPGQRICEWSCWWTTFDDWHPAKSDIRMSPTKQWFSRAPKPHN